ncbi:TyrS-associated PheT N-terminal domain-related protein TapR [Mycoplasmopsis canis]|uniref:TyrS-associated PheT N-terminal domain-related protein TapR n=1 Tax=Mycoplasmopsis canis TaxID=29555 RepID=UPI00025AEA14|nr:hypothetical protein [Mycoplasmopsis canis]EIE41145.1 hypothetical protein MCANUF33_00150 [Mycoplasmopsis canis UF33]
MIIVNNINNFFKNSAIVFVDSRINGKNIVKSNDLVFFVDDKKRIQSINVLNSDKYNLNNKKFYTTYLNSLDLIKNEAEKNGLVFEFSQKFIYVKITKRIEHPKSNKLFIITVNDGNKEFDLVTNTLDSEVGKVVVMALPGSVTFAGTKVLNGKIMDIESPGMLAGYKTLSINKEGLIFGDESQIGKDFII